MDLAIAALCVPGGTPGRLRPQRACFNDPVYSSGWFKVRSQAQIHVLLAGPSAQKSPPNDLQPSALFTALCLNLLKVTPSYVEAPVGAEHELSCSAALPAEHEIKTIFMVLTVIPHVSTCTPNGFINLNEEGSGTG